MNKKRYLKGKISQFALNSVEHSMLSLLAKKRPRNIRYIKKLKYSTGKENYLNAFYDETNKNQKPLFIYVHGGGWISGVTSKRNTYVTEFAKKGYFAVNIGYTYAPKKTYPAQFQEIFDAISLVYKMASQYKIDTSRIVVAGESAGGYFAAMLAAISCNHDLYEKLNISFEYKTQFAISAVIFNCGIASIERLADKTFPSSRFPGIQTMLSSFFDMTKKELKDWVQTEEGKNASVKVTKDFPPTMVITAKADLLRHEGEAFKKDLKNHGVEYEEYKGTGILSFHAWPLLTKFKKGRECLCKTMDFVNRFIFDGFGNT